MAIEKIIRHNADIIGDYIVICREVTVIVDDGREVSTSRIFKPYYPDSDWSEEDAKIKTVCDTHFTASTKTAWAAMSKDEQETIKNS